MIEGLKNFPSKIKKMSPEELDRDSELVIDTLKMAINRLRVNEKYLEYYVLFLTRQINKAEFEFETRQYFFRQVDNVDPIVLESRIKILMETIGAGITRNDLCNYLGCSEDVIEEIINKISMEKNNGDDDKSVLKASKVADRLQVSTSVGAGLFNFIQEIRDSSDTKIRNWVNQLTAKKLSSAEVADEIIDQLILRMNEMQEYLKSEISAQMQELRKDASNPTVDEINRLLQKAIKITFKVFEEEI